MRSVGSLQNRLRYVTDSDARATVRPPRANQEAADPVSRPTPYSRYERHGNNVTGGQVGERRKRNSGDRRKIDAANVRRGLPVEFRNGRDRRRTRNLGNEVVARIDEKA